MIIRDLTVNLILEILDLQDTNEEVNIENQGAVRIKSILVELPIKNTLSIDRLIKNIPKSIKYC
jgi:hypothetical protein